MTDALDVPAYDPQPLSAWPDILTTSDEIVIIEPGEGQHGWWTWTKEASYQANDPIGIGEQYHLKDVLRRTPGIVYYGLVRGKGELAFYDGYDLQNNRWLDLDECYGTVGRVLRMQCSTMLYRGPFSPGLAESYVGGPTARKGSIPPVTDGLPEPELPLVQGVLIRTISERFDRCGRVCFRVDGATMTNEQKAAALAFKAEEKRRVDEKMAEFKASHRW